MLFLVTDPCTTLDPTLKVLKTVFVLLKWIIPIVLILFGAIDLGKAVIASKEDEMKKAQGVLIKRVVYAAVIFFLFTIVQFVMSVLPNDDLEDTTTWVACWNKIKVFE